MMSRPRLLLAASCIGAAISAMPGWAQDSNVSFDAPGFVIKKPRAGAPDVKAQPQAWPRLDPGAVLCRSEADLLRLAQRRTGDVVNGPIDCQIIRAATAISIVERKGPGRTEVLANGAPASAAGWTDAWLPAKAPSGNAPAVR